MNDQDTELFEHLQRQALRYFVDLAQPANGLVADSTWEGSPASIAAVGFALSVYLVAVERGWLARVEGEERVLATLRFLAKSHQGPEPDATGYRGFYYHFLDMQSGQRAIGSELSTIDTTILMAGILSASLYFDREGAGEREIRRLADSLYRRIDWQWALDGGEASGMAGRRKAASSTIAGTDTTRDCSSICWVSALLSSRCPRRVMTPLPLPIAGRRIMGSRSSTPRPFSSITSPRLG